METHKGTIGNVHLGKIVLKSIGTKPKPEAKKESLDDKVDGLRQEVTRMTQLYTKAIAKAESYPHMGNHRGNPQNRGGRS